MPVKGDRAVVREVEWQRLHPIWLKSEDPLVMEEFGGAGVGGADNRMNVAKFTMSDDISDKVPIVVPKFGLLLFPLRMLPVSSGVELKTHPAVVLRSLGNSSLVTPCSTL